MFTFFHDDCGLVPLGQDAANDRNRRIVEDADIISWEYYFRLLLHYSQFGRHSFDINELNFTELSGLELSLRVNKEQVKFSQTKVFSA